MRTPCLVSKPDSIQSNLRNLDKTEGGKNVTLHYLVFENTIQVILTTPTFQTVQSSTIEPVKLNQLIQNYQTAIGLFRSRGVKLLNQPSKETAILPSTELYNLIFKPIEIDLNDYGATNLMVFLDGVLRYIPMPVLYDGQNFLLQRYRFANLTTSSMLNLKDQPGQISEKRFPSKIEAMRQAQLELAGLDDLMQPEPKTQRKKTAFASPYYWGPFIMMGNWR